MTDEINGTDVMGAFAQVKANNRKLHACPAHKFDPSGYRMGMKLTCQNCDGEMRAPDIMNYARGYQAAGGNPDLIWPGLLTPRATV